MGARSSRTFSWTGVALAIAACAHGVFAWHFSRVRPELMIMAPPPNPLAREAVAFGDHQFLYRIWAIDLQNAGDTGGRATALKDYNYEHVVGWLETLRALDPRSQFHTYLAAHYFGLSPKSGDIRAIVDFIVRDADAQSSFKWPWLMQATVMAENRLKDLPLAVSIAQKLAALEYAEIPVWVRFFPATLLLKLNRAEDARALVLDVRTRNARLMTTDDEFWADNFLRQLPIPAK